MRTRVHRANTRAELYAYNFLNDARRWKACLAGAHRSNRDRAAAQRLRRQLEWNDATADDHAAAVVERQLRCSAAHARERAGRRAASQAGIDRESPDAPGTRLRRAVET